MSQYCFCFIFFYGAAYAGAASNLSALYGKVIRVHDGDTVSILLNGRRERVRLTGIDAPELDQRPWGNRAKEYLEKLTSGSNRVVIVEFDLERRDKYGRLLCYLFTKDKRMINAEMLRQGYALLYTIPPNVKYVHELKNAMDEAGRRKIGIWEGKGLRESPANYRIQHPRSKR